jgi:hypothetical protein
LIQKLATDLFRDRIGDFPSMITEIPSDNIAADARFAIQCACIFANAYAQYIGQSAAAVSIPRQ